MIVYKTESHLKHQHQDRMAIFNAKRFWAQQMQPDIELEIPDQRAHRRLCRAFQSYSYYNGMCISQRDHYIRILPAGSRCFVISFHSKTLVKTASGGRFEFKSTLPGGGANSPNGKCILDCVICDQTIYILDIIEWGKMDFSEQVAEMRYFWIESNILTAKLDGGDFQFRWLPVYATLQDAITDKRRDYCKAGLLFIKKDSHYVNGVNPECIFFRDEHTDDSFREDIKEFIKSKKIKMLMSLQDGVLSTRDGVQMGTWKQPSQRKVVVEVELVVDQNCHVTDVREAKEFLEDPYSKVVFWSTLPELLFN